MVVSPRSCSAGHLTTRFADCTATHMKNASGSVSTALKTNAGCTGSANSQIANTVNGRLMASQIIVVTMAKNLNLAAEMMSVT